MLTADDLKLTADDIKQLEDLGQWYLEIHREHADGCKSSCGWFEYGVTLSQVWDYRHVFFRFGGYCFGQMRRREERLSDDVTSLVNQVREDLEEAMRHNIAMDDDDGYVGGA